MGAWLDFGMQAGLDVLKAGAGFFAAQKQAESDKKWQQYHNALVRMQYGAEFNAIAEQREQTREASMKQGLQIKTAAYTTEASATVAAAAAGVQGRSVDQVTGQIETNAAEATSNVERQLQWQNNAFETAHVNAAMQRDSNIQSKPPDADPWKFIAQGLGDLTKLWKDNSKALMG